MRNAFINFDSIIEGEKNKVKIANIKSKAETLKLKQDTVEMIKKFKDRIRFVIVGADIEDNLKEQKQWIKENISSDIEFISISGKYLNKSSINMSNSIYISNQFATLNRMAKIKILYDCIDSMENYANKDVLVVDNCSQIEEILNFYLEYDYNTLR